MNDVGAVIDFVRIVGTQLSVVQIEYLIGENEEFSFSGKLEDPLRIGFNLEFLSEALKSMEEDEVSAWVVGPLSPVKLIEPQYEALVLPVKVRGEA